MRGNAAHTLARARPTFVHVDGDNVDADDNVDARVWLLFNATNKMAQKSLRSVV